MKRAVQSVTLLAIAFWLACIGSIQAAIWNEAARSQWSAEAWVWGLFAIALSVLAGIGWGVLPPPEDN